MDHTKEFKKYAIQHHGINSLYYDQLVSSMTPYIIEERQMNVAQMDVFSRLMMDRILTWSVYWTYQRSILTFKVSNPEIQITKARLAT